MNFLVITTKGRMEKIMRQVILERVRGPLSVREANVPKPNAGEVLVRIKAATICSLTDVHTIEGIHPPHDRQVEGMLPHDLRILLGSLEDDPLHKLYPKKRFPENPFPTLMGHEAAGDIVEMGDKVNTPDRLVFSDEELSVGDRVSTFKVRGGYSEYSCVPANNVVRIPSGMSYEEASLLEPLIFVHNCMKKCFRLTVPNTVAILGQGCLGLFATQLAKIFGAKRTIVSEPSEYKRGLAIKLGADVALDPNNTNIVHEIEHLTNSQGTDLVLECVGVPETIKVLPYITKRGGIIGQMGACGVPVQFDYGYVHFKHITVVPTDYVLNLHSISSQLEGLLELIISGAIDLKTLISHRFSLDKINDAFELLVKNKDGVTKIAIIP